MTTNARQGPLAAMGKRRWCLALLFAGVGALGFGCNPQTLGFLLMLTSDNKIDPVCKLASADKEVKIVILPSMDTETRPELLRVDRELAEKLAELLRVRFKENKEKVTIVPLMQVNAYRDRRANQRNLFPQEIGRHFQADYVLSLEVNSISLYEKGMTACPLFRGRADITVTVLDVNKSEGEAPIFEKEYACEYPRDRPIDAGSVSAFRAGFLNRMAKDLAKNFAAYPLEQSYETME
jgi:hypothetical protein